MIIGSGLLAQVFASALAEREDVAVFAAGVSNSAERDLTQFNREQRLLEGVLAQKGLRRIVYFGSCAVGNPHEFRTPYLEHKTRMEALVAADPRGLVLRLPQVVGRGGNPHTLTNFLRARIASGQIFDVWTLAERNLIDVEDVATIGVHIIDHSEDFSVVVPIADLRSSSMLLIVNEMERAMGSAANYRKVERGAPFPIDTTACERAARNVGIRLGDGYLRRLIEKYYARGGIGRS
jgi:nucleoside-diphosphate-sugar epimerase